jgi:hypothetical protein
MAPNFHQSSADDGGPTTSAPKSSIYAFPFPSSSATTTPFVFGVTGSATATPKQSTTIISSNSSSDKQQQQQQQPMKREIMCSPIPSAISTFHLRQRLIPPTFIIPLVVLLLAPTVVVTILTTSVHLAMGVTHNVSRIMEWITSMAILAGTIFIVHEGRSAIERYAPNDKARDVALQRSEIALPFWSLIISIVIVRVVVFGVLGYIAPSLFGLSNGGMIEDGFGGIWDLVRMATLRTIQVAGACIAPALGWMSMSILVLLRYTGPFCPIGKSPHTYPCLI